MLGMRNILIYFSLKNNGLFHKIFKSLKNKDFLVPSALSKVVEYDYENKFNAITIIDEDYPDFLKKQNNPPFVIYCRNFSRKEFIEQINSFLSKFDHKNVDEDNKFIQPYLKKLAIIPEELKQIQKQIRDLIIKDKLKSIN